MIKIICWMRFLNMLFISDRGKKFKLGYDCKSVSVCSIVK